MTLSVALGTLLEFKRHALELFLSLTGHADQEVADSIRDLVEEEHSILAGLEACMARQSIPAGEVDGGMLDGLLSMEYFRLHTREASVPDRVKALDLAIQFEKDALLLFTEIWTLCPGEECQTALHELITLEKQHLLRLLDMRRQPVVTEVP